MRNLIKTKLPAIAGLILLVIGTGSVLRAHNNQGGNNNNQGGYLGSWPRPYAVPEIDPANGTAAVALLAGVVLIIRGRRKTVTN